MTRNEEIKRKAKISGVCLWQIAEALGIADHAFSRKLRRELPDEEKEKILAIIDKLKKGVR